MQDQLRGGAEEAVDESDEDGIAAEVWQIGVLANECEVNELGEPVEREREREREKEQHGKVVKKTEEEEEEVEKENGEAERGRRGDHEK